MHGDVGNNIDVVARDHRSDVARRRHVAVSAFFTNRKRQLYFERNANSGISDPVRERPRTYAIAKASY